MSVIYSRPDTPVDWMKMSRLEVQIWNILSDGPLNSWVIYTRIPKNPRTEHSDIVKALAKMEKDGNVTAQYST